MGTSENGNGNHRHSENEKLLRKRIPQAKRVDYPRLDQDHHEEYAAEIAPGPSVGYNDDVNNDDVQIMESRTGQMVGYVGLAFGIVSLFMWSIILGPVAAIIGYYAFSKGNKGTGGWSMALGILATLSYFVL